MSTSLHDARKLFAAAVIVAFLATLLSFEGISKAGKGSACPLEPMPMLRLEWGQPLCPSPSADLACILKGQQTILGADNYFLIGYSALNLSFFLFLAATGAAHFRRRGWIFWFGGVGLLLAIAMCGADGRENQILGHWLDGTLAHVGVGALCSSLPSLPEHLVLATTVKWGALAVASAILGLIYLFDARRPARLIAVPAFAAAEFLAVGLAMRKPDFVMTGASALFVFWIAVLIHAVIVAIASARRQPQSRPTF